jgi:hypothetical protein
MVSFLGRKCRHNQQSIRGGPLPPPSSMDSFLRYPLSLFKTATKGVQSCTEVSQHKWAAIFKWQSQSLLLFSQWKALFPLSKNSVPATLNKSYLSLSFSTSPFFIVLELLAHLQLVPLFVPPKLNFPLFSSPSKIIAIPCYLSEAPFLTHTSFNIISLSDHEP